MIHTRRRFLKTGSMAIGGLSAVPLIGDRFKSTSFLQGQEGNTSIVFDHRHRELLSIALDSAKITGAEYSDVRLTHSWNRRLIGNAAQVIDGESITVGVRALKNGYWGFASGPVWTKDELARLGKDATLQAQENGFGKERSVTLAPPSPLVDGEWIMPVERDPFDVHPFEIQDVIKGLSEYARRYPPLTGVFLDLNFFRQDKLFASTEGVSFSQRTYRSAAQGGVMHRINGQNGSILFDYLPSQGRGFEILDEADLRSQVQIVLERFKADNKLPAKAVDVGRYDMVLSDQAMSQLIGRTIGVACELDRALGYEANAGGTSYLFDPAEMLGTLKIGNANLNIGASRRMPGGLATSAWDDEGVSAKEYQIVRDGKLMDFHTSRESSGWIKDWYDKNGIPVESNGCAFAPAGVDTVLTHTPNLNLTPSTNSDNFDSLITSLEDGIAFRAISLSVDFQCSGGQAYSGGTCYEVKKGKPVSRLVGASFMFRTSELWNSIIALGGKDATRMHGVTVSKGQPAQSGFFSVSSPPGLFEKLTLIDAARKA